MIVADTNVISELMRSSSALFDGQRWIFNHTDELVVTAVTRYEILVGIRLLPDGRRKRYLAEGAARILNGRHCLEFDVAVADVCADAAAVCLERGRPRSTEDYMIAAICLSRGLPLATRNVKDFESLGLTLINPWEPPNAWAPPPCRRDNPLALLTRRLRAAPAWRESAEAVLG